MAFLVTITKITMLNVKFSVTISNQLENVKKKTRLSHRLSGQDE